MKVGITIKDYFKEYLEKIAQLNHVSVTKVCSLICENFLSYNLKRKVFPTFRKYVRIEFNEESVESGIDNNRDFHPARSVNQDSEHSDLSWNDMIVDLDFPGDPIDDDSFPF